MTFLFMCSTDVKLCANSCLLSYTVPGLWPTRLTSNMWS